jgi:hypothetical protein
MNQAAQYFVDIDELQEKVGQRIAEWTHNEAAYVTCGAAAGLTLSTAACITGLDAEKRARLPETEGMKNEIIIHRSGKVGYAFAIRQAGDPARVERVASLLEQAERPLIVAGGGARSSGAHAELRALAELLGMPVMTTPSGRGIIVEDHPLSPGQDRKFGESLLPEPCL